MKRTLTYQGKLTEPTTIHQFFAGTGTNDATTYPTVGNVPVVGPNTLNEYLMVESWTYDEETDITTATLIYGQLKKTGL